MLLLALVALGVPLALSLRDRVDAEVRGQARSQADVVAASAAEPVSSASGRSILKRLVSVSARTVRGRVIIVDRSGKVVADSAGPSELGADYSNRPEVQSALGGASYQATRQSSTLGENLLATAVPILHGGRDIGAVRITQSVEAINDAVERAVLDLGLLGGVVLLLGLVAGALIAQQIARPIRRLDAAARRVSAGDLAAQVPVEGSTEQRSLARAFNDMTDRVGRLLRSQQEFVADASHQLRTPLTGIRLRLEELREAAGEGGPEATQLDAGLTEVDRLSQIVDELLILSRAGERELPGEEVDLAAAADRAVERWQATARDQGVTLVRERRPGETSAWIASVELDRALDSLVENAVRYSPGGSEVTVTSAPGRIEVADDGPGLERGEEEAVFERFYRGSAGRRGPKGTGLGLAIARELAGRWGGTVKIENRPGGGALASLDLPAQGNRYGDRR